MQRTARPFQAGFFIAREKRANCFLNYLHSSLSTQQIEPEFYRLTPLLA